MFSEVVPVLVGVLGAKGRDGGGAVGAPVHAGAFETLAHESFGCRFDHALPDGPVLLSETGVVQAVQTALDVVSQGVQRPTLLTTP